MYKAGNTATSTTTNTNTTPAAQTVQIMFNGNGKSGYSYSKYLTTTAPKAKATQVIKDGTYEIAPNYATDMRLDVSGASKDNGANVQIYKANSTNAQKWKIF